MLNNQMVFVSCFFSIGCSLSFSKTNSWERKIKKKLHERMRSGTSCVFSAEFLPFLYLETMLWAANITNHGNTEYVCVQIKNGLGWFGRKKKTTKKEKIEEPTTCFSYNSPNQWIGLRENLQENPIFTGKIYGFL